MAHPKETRHQLRKLFIEGMALSAASAMAGVSYESARAWKAQAQKEGDDWDTTRAAFSLSGKNIGDINTQLVEQIARQVVIVTREIDEGALDAVTKVKLLSQISDAYSKFSLAFGKINPEIGGLSIALDVLKTITQHLSEHDRAALEALKPHIDAIGATMSRRFGGAKK